MKISEEFKTKIMKSVVRIISDTTNINWNIPYIIEKPSRGQGTGFFIDSSYILTCAHVVNGATNLYIEIPSISSDKYICTVISIVPEFDIALIKCDSYKSKYYLTLGDSDNLQINDNVIVAGYPVSFKYNKNNSNNLKFTSGIISGQQNGFIQTDSAINPGNSGGPLFGKNNKVIGINSMKLVGQSLENIGASVPINYYKVVKDNINEKIIHRPDLLFKYNNTNTDIINKLTKNKINNGIIVAKIYDDSPLKNTEIKENMIITEINNIKLDNYGLSSQYKWIGSSIHINVILNKLKNKDTIAIKYFDNMDNKIKQAKIKLSPYIKPIRIMYPIFEKIEYFILGGTIFMNLSKNHIIDNLDNPKIFLLGMDEKNMLKEKLFVSFIAPNSKINILNNITEYDTIKKINDIEVNNLNELYSAIHKFIIINNEKFIKIEESEGRSVIISLKDLLNDDILFSELYKYPFSNFHKKYINAI